MVGLSPQDFLLAVPAGLVLWGAATLVGYIMDGARALGRHRKLAVCALW
jgi:hypothetical protein